MNALEKLTIIVTVAAAVAACIPAQWRALPAVKLVMDVIDVLGLNLGAAKNQNAAPKHLGAAPAAGLIAALILSWPYLARPTTPETPAAPAVTYVADAASLAADATVIDMVAVDAADIASPSTAN